MRKPDELPAEGAETAMLAAESCEKKEGAFSHGGVRFHYRQWRAPADHVAEAPPFVLLHGFAQSAASWSEVAPLLAAGRTVYALDLVGHGETDRPATSDAYALEFQAQALCAFLAFVSTQPVASIRRVSPDHPTALKENGEDAPPLKPIVVGYSMGGRVALSALAHHVDLFGGLVLESAGLGPATEDERQAALDRDVRCAARLREQGVEAFMDFWEQLPLFATQQRLPAEVRQRVRIGRLGNDAEALARTFEHAGQHVMPARGKSVSTLMRAAQAGLPLLYLAGSLDAKYRPLAESLATLFADSALTQTPAMRVSILDGAGHNVHLETPENFVCELSVRFEQRPAMQIA